METNNTCNEEEPHFNVQFTKTELLTLKNILLCLNTPMDWGFDKENGFNAGNTTL